MTPREALYYICVALGPVPITQRDYNLTYEQIKVRDAVSVLQELIETMDMEEKPNDDS